VPVNSNWYLCELVVQLDVEDDPRGVVHINTCLVEAASADEAYDKAMELGRDEEHEYANPKGRRVRTRFVGLRELVEVFEPLEDGAELTFQERVGISDLETRRLVARREELSVFKVGAPSTAPDYSAGEIMADVDDVLPPRVATIHHVTLAMPRAREAEARRFYGELLGLTEIEPPRRQRDRALWLVAGDRQLRLLVDERARPSRLALEVTKLDAWRTRLTNAGLDVRDGEPPPGYRAIAVEDPFGNTIELIDRK
jgi:catechol 2,3-dioxygenase-like lactoylglutathione lyase family enzyme